MAERPRELDQRFQTGGGGQFEAIIRLKSYFSGHCDMTQFTLTHHHGKQTISSTRLNTDLDAVDGDAINIAADHQMFMTPTGELS